jgi:hypothetical protein
VGGSKIFRARSIGEPEGRTSSAIVLPICATGADTTPICDETMDDEACILLMIFFPSAGLETNFPLCDT